MFDTQITVTGNVTKDPEQHTFDDGSQVVNFRIASTSRRRGDNGQYADHHTLYLDVNCWGKLARHVAASVHKGQPVIVQGNIYTRSYVSDEQRRSTYELRAFSIGHNLAGGTTTFAKSGGYAVTSVATDEDGQPADVGMQMLVDEMRQNEYEAQLPSPTCSPALQP
jgi:single-strand DNA-binding protein